MIAVWSSDADGDRCVETLDLSSGVHRCRRVAHPVGLHWFDTFDTRRVAASTAGPS